MASESVEAMKRAVASMERTRDAGATLIAAGMPVVCCPLMIITALSGRPVEHVQGCGALRGVRS